MQGDDTARRAELDPHAMAAQVAHSLVDVCDFHRQMKRRPTGQERIGWMGSIEHVPNGRKVARTSSSDAYHVGRSSVRPALNSYSHCWTHASMSAVSRPTWEMLSKEITGCPSVTVDGLARVVSRPGRRVRMAVSTRRGARLVT